MQSVQGEGGGRTRVTSPSTSEEGADETEVLTLEETTPAVRV